MEGPETADAAAVNSALTLFALPPLSCLSREVVCVLAGGFTAFDVSKLQEGSYGCMERPASRLSPNACPRWEKAGLKTDKAYLEDVIAFFFIKLVLTVQSALKAGVF